MNAPQGRGVNVDPATLDQLAGRVGTVHEEIGGILRRVQGIADSLANPAVWSGQGSARFMQVRQEWQQNSAALNTALTGIEDGLRNNRTGLENADQDTGATISRINTSEPLNIPG